MDIKKVLVADAVDNACVDLLKKYNIEVDCKYKLSKEQLIEEIVVCIEEIQLKGVDWCCYFIVSQNYDAIIVRSDTKVTADVIQAGKRLKAIGRAGAGVDNIDVNAATAANVVVLK